MVHKILVFQVEKVAELDVDSSIAKTPEQARDYAIMRAQARMLAFSKPEYNLIAVDVERFYHGTPKENVRRSKRP